MANATCPVCGKSVPVDEGALKVHTSSGRRCSGSGHRTIAGGMGLLEFTVTVAKSQLAAIALDTISLAGETNPADYDLTISEEAGDIRIRFVRRTDRPRPITAVRPAPRSRRSKNGADEVRQWAKGQGIEVASHGRIPFEIHQAYANRDKTPESAAAD